MDNKSKLKLVKSNKKSKKKSIAPRAKCCPLGDLEKVHNTKEEAGDWWINSEKHRYCFWQFIKDRSNPEGVMKELVQSELAGLFNWSNTKTHLILKEAMEELVTVLEERGGRDLIANSEDPQSEGSLLIQYFLNLTDSPSE